MSGIGTGVRFMHCQVAKLHRAGPHSRTERSVGRAPPLFLQYDLSVSTFSPDGRVFQTEYAQKAVDSSGYVGRFKGL